MKPWFTSLVLLCYGSVVHALPHSSLEITFASGRVTMFASDAPLTDVLAAWARTGHVDLTGTEYLGARRITIHLTNTAEPDALKAIIGSPAWFTTVAREGAGNGESAFQRIVLLPEAAAAADSGAESMPERQYSYYISPQGLAGADALLSMRPGRITNEPRPQGEPESIYQYSAPTAFVSDEVQRTLPPPGGEAIQPMFSPSGAEPERVYVYSPTPEPTEPLAQSTLVPPPQTIDPEARFHYAPPTSGPRPDMWLASVAVPDLQVFDGFKGFTRLPGRLIRYASER